jgi:nucleoside-diphosphate-sugar epimerase
VELIEGSVDDAHTLRRAFDGVDLFHNCVNLPYPEWSKSLLAIHDKIIEVASEAKTPMVFPGNVYIYGRSQAERVREGHPRMPCSKKGRLRLELEDIFMQHSREGSVPCVIMRFPDYYGPNSASIVDGVFRSALKNKTARWYGKLDAIHEFIFIADAAKAMIMASERPDAFGQDFNVPGPEPIRVRDWIDLVFKEVGNKPNMTGTSHAFIQFAGLFNGVAREYAEMQYLAEEPLILDGGKFNNFFGTKYPARSYGEGIRETLTWLRSVSDLS